MFVLISNPINVFSKLFIHMHVVTYERSNWSRRCIESFFIDELVKLIQIRCGMRKICFPDVEFTIDFSGENAKMRGFSDCHDRSSSLKVVDLRTEAKYCSALSGPVDPETMIKNNPSALTFWRIDFRHLRASSYKAIRLSLSKSE